MVGSFSAFMLFGMGFLCLSMNANSTGDKIMSEENSNVIKTIKAMTSSFNKKDVNGILGAYELGAAVMFAPGEKMTDPAELRKMFEGAFQANPKFSYPQGHEVYIANDIALHIAPWVMSGKALDGTVVQQSGLSVAVLRRQKDGNWLLVLDNPNGQHLMEKP